jgi:hypothetical protein
MSRTGKLAVVLLTWLSAAAADAADLYVIAHPALTLQPSEVRDVYLGEKQFSGAVRLRPVDNAAVQEAFLAKVMHMPASVYGTSWTKKAFREGLTPPPLQSTDADVIEFVKRNEGSVGYVTTAPSNVKVLQKLPD